VKSRAASKSKIITMRLSPDEDFGHKWTKVSCAATVWRRHRHHPVGTAANPMNEFDLLVLTDAQVAGLAMDDVVLFDEVLRFRRAAQVALHRHYASAKRLSVVV